MVMSKYLGEKNQTNHIYIGIHYKSNLVKYFNCTLFANTNAKGKAISPIFFFFTLQFSFLFDFLIVHHSFVLFEIAFLIITAEYLIFINTLCQTSRSVL